MPHMLKSSLFHKAILWFVVIAALAMVILGAISIVASLRERHVLVHLGQTVFKTDVADTDAERKQGLSGVDTLAASEGMLFVFPSNDTWSIWMKGMNLPIDIVWLDEDKRVVHTEKNVQPDSPPHATYRPSVPARYVVELSAGSVKKYKIKVNDVAVFQLPNEEI